MGTVKFKRPAWMVEADSNIGVREIPGPTHNPKILGWLARLKAWWREDETPWCGTFVAHCILTAGIEPPKEWYRAKAWATWGSRLSPPRYGAILVFDRAGGGHVGFYASEDHEAYHVLGGNQSNQVNLTRIAKSRLVASRWPKGEPVTTIALHSDRNGKLSENEA